MPKANFYLTSCFSHANYFYLVLLVSPQKRAEVPPSAWVSFTRLLTSIAAITFRQENIRQVCPIGLPSPYG